MKIKPLLIPFLICLVALVLSSAIPTAQASPVSDMNFKRAFISYSDQLDEHPWWQSHTIVDPKSGRAHVTYFTDGSIFYASCQTNCGDAASWSKTAVSPAGDYSSLTFPTLSLDSSGRPRMVWYSHPNYVYMECNTGCMQAASWKSVKLTLNPDNFNNYPQNPRYLALNPQNQPRFISYYHEGFTYAYCNNNCLTASSWNYKEVEIGYVDDIEAPQLEITSSGKLVVAGYNGWTNDLMYAECSQNCHIDANWKWVKVAEEVGGPYFAMRLDRAGRPRIAFFKMNASDEQMYYAWSNANFTSAVSWTIDTLPLPPDTERTLDLAIDSQGNPHIVYVDDNADLRYLRCTSGCNTLSSDWWLQYVETRDDLDTNEPVDPGGFDISAWTISGYPSLALDSGDSPVLSFYARCERFSGISPYPGVWAVRFATALNLGHSVFLPLTRR